MARQLAAHRATIARGGTRLGWKIGVNVPEVQRALGLAYSLVGCLDGNAVGADGERWPLAPGALLHVEPELALRVAHDVAAGLSSTEGRAAIGAVAPALEIVDYARGGSDLDALLAHSMFHAGIILGEFRAPPPPSDAGVGWPTIFRDGKRIGTPRSDLVAVDLSVIVAHVARYLAAFGERLAAGDLILSGSFMERAVRLDSGSEIRADFGPLGWRSVRGEAV
jgi:2-keto-4-pentenoate hydratase